ncbi:MAG: SemiSWEET transporter [Candidatus Colwellbacteria bacterium]|nr:SemiSWEET transporter [Candidatus Colwellbacteria bacterium]
MDFITILGFVAGILTTTSFLPQVIKSWKTEETKDISLPMYIIFTTGAFLWLIYGILLNQPPIYVANGVTLILVSSILILKIKHG